MFLVRLHRQLIKIGDPDVTLPMHCTGEAFIAMLRERMPGKVV